MHNDSRSPIPQFNSSKRNTLIAESVAQLPQSENPEEIGFVISFQHYRDDLCEIKLLSKNGGRRALENLRVIGKSYNKFSLRQNNIDIDPVANNGEYKKLYNGLSPDVEILEHRIQSTARLFYFFVNNYFYIRAIKNSHFETDKQR